MGFNGDGQVVRTDGTRTGPTVWDQARVARVSVNSADHDTHDQDLADAIANCLALDGQNSPTADISLGTHKFTGAGDAVLTDQFATLGQLRREAPHFIAAADVGGTGDAVTLTPSPAFTAYETGQAFRFFIETENTGAVTIALNGLDPVSVRSAEGDELSAGDLEVGHIIEVVHDGTRFVSDVHSHGGLDAAEVRRIVTATDLSGDRITSGTIAPARLGASPAASKYLKGDGSWADPFSVSKPALFAFSDGDGAVVLYYAIPASESAIQARNIRVRDLSNPARPAPVSGWRAGPSPGSPHRITGLVNGRSYDFAVRGRNLNGRTPWSDVVQATPTVKPWESATPGDYTFSWPWRESTAFIVARGGGQAGDGVTGGGDTTVTLGDNTVTAPGERAEVADIRFARLTGLSVGSSLSITVGALSGTAGGSVRNGLIYIFPV